MKIYTIGFTKKTAEQFFKLLEDNGIVKVVDIRLNNKSQLAGFAKSPDLEYFLGEHCIDYEYDVNLAPTEDLKKRYSDKKQKMTFDEYTVEFLKILEERKCIEPLKKKDLDKYCYLCSEDKADECHRRLVVEAIKEDNDDIEIIHL
jgi:uncharacterized protein (DUF488 family)